TLKTADEELVFGVSESEDVYEVQNNIEKLQKEMMEAAQNLQFERAAQLRDKIKELEERIQADGR
ncbi:MAG: UvrB/UvrC motif-containing protein, partial [Clostridiales bacterium]